MVQEKPKCSSHRDLMNKISKECISTLMQAHTDLKTWEEEEKEALPLRMPLLVLVLHAIASFALYSIFLS